MAIFTFAGRKGGCGKTTGAVNYAVWLLKQGYRVGFLDAETENQAGAFAAARETNPDLAKLHYEHVTGDIRRSVISMSEEYDHLVIDTPGLASVETNRAIIAATVAVFPFKLSSLDMRTLPAVADLVTNALGFRDSLAALCYASEMPPGTSGKARRTEAQTAIVESFPMLKMLDGFTVVRNAYRDSIPAGAGVLEWGDAKASEEFNNLAKEIFSHAS